MNVEFAPPVGYSEPKKIVKENQEEHMDTFEPITYEPEDQGFVAFAGQGIRLDGKVRKVKDDEPPVIKASYKRGVPDYDYQFGSLKFIRAPKKEDDKKKESAETSTFEAFSGAGKSLRQTKLV
ncbi:hypothetical protein GHT06_016602 [Daphnia sinensis]|uniref:Uncharacterized protein n=1 Tax=Daphnia sinensis TaxID=1820382 RepID=A0AAD5L669_9CRUS|nr:hypothetical protein GHT06_016602 [Daphnia sinensis]